LLQKKCWYTDTDPPENGIRLAFKWLLENPASRNGVIVAANTNGVLERALMEVFDRQQATKIVQEKIKQIDGIGLTTVTEKRTFWQSANNRILLALYPDKRFLDVIDSINGVSEMVVVPWTMREIEDWKSARNATVLGATPLAKRAESAIQNRTVRNAMRSLSRSVNKSTELGHPADKSRAVDTFFILLENGERYAPKEIKVFLVAEEGWEPVKASEVEELAKAILEGKKPRRVSSWASNILEIWRSEQ
jgi:hypothetical protein